MRKEIIGDAVLYLGDCLDRMRDLPDSSVDSIVTDPPYELGFMGKGWDKSGIANSVEMWREALRVLKPGGHLLAFSGSRTYHRMVCAIEDSGFEVRDQIMWLYGSGFPKSHDVSKAIGKAAGAGRETAYKPHGDNAVYGEGKGKAAGVDRTPGAILSEPAVTDAARQWQGWGTALKPAHEPICVARKPLAGTVAANVLEHGTGALNIDGCRVGTEENLERVSGGAENSVGNWGMKRGHTTPQPSGRWPANVIHDGSDEVLAVFPDAPGQQGDLNSKNARPSKTCFGDMAAPLPHTKRTDATKSAARFFYCAKASKKDRDDGLESFEPSQAMFAAGTGLRNNGDGTPRNQTRTVRNTHPTVKPTDLMRYLCRLVTPPNGIVLDPFMGSGSTGKAAMLEGFRFIGIDMTPEYIEIAKKRIGSAQRQDNLF